MIQGLVCGMAAMERIEKMKTLLIATASLAFTACLALDDVGINEESNRIGDLEASNLGSGIDPEKTFETTTAAELRQMCLYVTESLSVHDAIAFDCFWESLLHSQSSCEATYAECMSNHSSEILNADWDCNLPSGIGFWSPCVSLFTVGEVERCVRSESDAHADLVTSLTCDSTSADMEIGSTTPLECQEIEEACPELRANWFSASSPAP